MFPTSLHPEYKKLIGIIRSEEYRGSCIHQFDARFLRQGLTLQEQSVLDDIVYFDKKGLVPITVYRQGDFNALFEIDTTSPIWNYFITNVDDFPPLMVLSSVESVLEKRKIVPYLSLHPRSLYERVIAVHEEGMLSENPRLDVLVSEMVDMYSNKEKHFGRALKL